MYKYIQGQRSQGLPLLPPVTEVQRIRGDNLGQEQPLEPKNIEEEEKMEENQVGMGQNRMQEEVHGRPLMMRDYAMPIIGLIASSIVLGEAAINYDLKDIHYNMLPAFHGLPSEDPLTFMRDFYSTLQTFPLHGLNEDQLRMRCFPYTLKDRAKAWLMMLPLGLLTSWEDVYHKFIGKFYSHPKTAEMRTRIFTFTQFDGDPFHEAWERFKTLLNQCPHHQLPIQLQTQIFYDALTPHAQQMVDNAAGGVMWQKTAEETYDIYEMLGANSHQKSVRGRKATVNEVSQVDNALVAQVAELVKQVKALTTQPPRWEVCAICQEYGHGPTVCPRALEMPTKDEEANYMGAQQQR